MSEYSIDTKIVHSGERQTPPAGQPVAIPIYTSATYTYPTMAEMDQVFAGEGGDFVYSRYGNPTVAALQDSIGALENGKVSIAFGSGMAAIHGALMACELQVGSVVLASRDLYGASYDLLYKIFAPLGIKSHIADFNDLDSLKSKVEEVRPQVLLTETISNPLLKVCDISAVAEIAHTASARLIVDNTFASPYLCRPLDLGADFSLHSATKYLGGHADSAGGVVVSNEETDRASLTGVMKLVGGVLSVWEAHHILRGVKTLALRLERQCQNARVLAERLAGNERIEQVYYPTLSGDKALTARVLRQPFGGGLVTIRLKKDTREAAYKFMDSLRLCVRGTSLGDVYTMMSHSSTSSHRELSPKKRSELGITDGLVRISAGIENVDDILYDIENALIQ